MSRQRFIYPETFASDDFVALSIGARLLFIGMFATADDFGRGKGSVGVLKATVFPADDLLKTQVAEWAEEIRRRKMVRFYESDGSIYYEVAKWEKWQRPKYKVASKIPPFSRNTRLWPGLGAEAGTNQGQSSPESGTNWATGREGLGSDGLGWEGTGRVGSPESKLTGEVDASSPPPVSDPDPRREVDPVTEERFRVADEALRRMRGGLKTTQEPA